MERLSRIRSGVALSFIRSRASSYMCRDIIRLGADVQRVFSEQLPQSFLAESILT